MTKFYLNCRYFATTVPIRPEPSFFTGSGSSKKSPAPAPQHCPPPRVAKPKSGSFNVDQAPDLENRNRLRIKLIFFVLKDVSSSTNLRPCLWKKILISKVGKRPKCRQIWKEFALNSRYIPFVTSSKIEFIGDNCKSPVLGMGINKRPISLSLLAVQARIRYQCRCGERW